MLFKYKLSDNVDSCISCPIVYKDRYERVLRELDFTKIKLQKQHEEELVQEHNLKTGFETRQACCAGLQGKESLHIPCYPRQQIQNQGPMDLHLLMLQLHR